MSSLLTSRIVVGYCGIVTPPSRDEPTAVVARLRVKRTLPVETRTPFDSSRRLVQPPSVFDPPPLVPDKSRELPPPLAEVTAVRGVSDGAAHGAIQTRPEVLEYTGKGLARVASRGSTVAGTKFFGGDCSLLPAAGSRRGGRTSTAIHDGLLRLKSSDNLCNEGLLLVRTGWLRCQREGRLATWLTEMLGLLGSASCEFSSMAEVKVDRRSNASRGSVSRTRYRRLTGSVGL
ncbi:DNAJ heat shock N-terminal domain-containing protein [Striga asiatica]|uniref:DNAJ heat shock N-terminal domain-containing protein n=1 Tax=Striga asiatica TaxID=4170 RepID=A0A5A7RAG9_STRAF|nr:DNAJ heat shock N-terminal domain-containing protein [Striga asiatica]